MQCGKVLFWPSLLLFVAVIFDDEVVAVQILLPKLASTAANYTAYITYTTLQDPGLRAHCPDSDS